MSKEELDLYLTGNVEDIGRHFVKGKLANNHKYKNTEKYVHMFRKIKDIDIIRQKRNFEYLVTFDIPMIILMISQGKGLYNYTKKGKFKQKYVKEFAVNTKYMKPEYFINYKKIGVFELKMEDVEAICKNAKHMSSDNDFLKHNTKTY